MGKPLRKLQRQPTDLTRKVGSWASVLFDTRLRASAVLSNQTGMLGSTYGDHLVSSAAGPADELRREKQRGHDLSKGGMREIFSRLYSYDEPAVLDTPAQGSKLVQQSHDLLDGLDEFQQLREQVKGDPDMAAIAASKLAGAIAKQLPKAVASDKRKQQEEKRQLAEQLGLPVPPAPKGGDVDESDAYIKLAMRSAVEETKQEVNRVRSALGTIPGMGAAPATHEQSDTRRMQLAERIATEDMMARVLRIAGRMRRVRDAKRKVKSTKAVGSVVGVTTGKDLGLLIGSERSMFGSPAFRSRQVMKLMQGQLLQYDMRGKEKLGRGPMVLLLDTSGSMQGEPLLWGAAVAIALATIAAKEKRPYTVVAFNRSVCDVLRLDKQGNLFQQDRHDPSESEAIEGGVAEMVLRIASIRAGGGTAFSRPVEYALDMEQGVTKEKADLIIVTDGGSGETGLPAPLLQRLQLAKDGGLRMYGLTVNGGSFSKQTRELCDECGDIDSDKEACGAHLPA